MIQEMAGMNARDTQEVVNMNMDSLSLLLKVSVSQSSSIYNTNTPYLDGSLYSYLHSE